MPRPNPARTIDSERALARRIAYEREKEDMTYDGLAARMTSVGCPIQGSAIYKIEKAGRRITVDELVAFALVFKTSVANLLKPVEHVMYKEIEKLEAEDDAAWRDLYGAVERVVEAMLARAALYERAVEGDDEALVRAVHAYWDDRSQPRVTAAPGQVREGLAKAMNKIEAEQASWTPEQWRRHEITQKVDDALDALSDVIHEITDPNRVLG